MSENEARGLAPELAVALTRHDHLLENPLEVLRSKMLLGHGYEIELLREQAANQRDAQAGDRVRGQVLFLFNYQVVSPQRVGNLGKRKAFIAQRFSEVARAVLKHPLLD